jgi:hypothetical protein
MCESCRNGGKPIATTLIRVSNATQEELSPESQRNAVKPWLETQGYLVPDNRILEFTWTSQELLDCSEIRDKLLPWVRNGEIHTIGMVHLDRLAGTPGTIAYIWDECQKYNVRILAKDTPIPEGMAGEVVALVIGLTKKQTVVSNRPRVKRGLADRAKLKGLPICGKAPYGYQPHYTIQGNEKVLAGFVPEPSTYLVAGQLFHLALKGVSIRRICSDLYVIPTPTGRKVWQPCTISKMLRNPVYGGRYYALRREVKEPEKRRNLGKTYSKSSTALRPEQDWVWLKNFKIESPIVTWEEWESIQQRLKLNKAYAQRNAKRLYILAGMLVCAECGRRLRGNTPGGARVYHYRCPNYDRPALDIPKCSCPRFNGPRIEAVVWEKASEFLKDPRTFIAEMERRRGAHEGREEEIHNRIKTLERQVNEETELEQELLRLNKSC